MSTLNQVLSQSLEMYFLSAEKLDFKIENILYLKQKTFLIIWAV